MCIRDSSYSGRCLLSNYMTGRDASRGACAQPCRYHYALMEEKRPGEYFPIEEDEKGSYILNSRDMCMICLLYTSGLVIADRYTTSNAVHQASKLPPEERTVFLNWLFELEYGKLGPVSYTHLRRLPGEKS